MRWEDIGHLETGSIQLDVNGKVTQSGDLNQMIWKIPEMVSYLSRFYDIAAGDLIMSGTPAGVGPVVKGDKLVAKIDRLPNLNIVVV